MRASFILLALAAASIGATQSVISTTEFPEEGNVYEAFNNLRANDTLMFDVQGTETMGRAIVPVHAALYYRLSTDPRSGRKSFAQVEIDVYDRDTPNVILRIVGDGHVLCRYDLVRGTVSSTTYGYYGDREPAGYSGSDAPKLFSQLKTIASGPSYYLARLLADLNPAGLTYTNRYSTWVPSSKPESIKGVLVPPVSDPLVPTRTYGADGSDYLVYGINGHEGLPSTAYNRTVAVRYENTGTVEAPYYQLDNIYVAHRTATGLLDITITPSVATPPAWAFVSYTVNPLTNRAFIPINRGI